MKIAIIGAMQKEINFLINKLENLKERDYLKFTFYEGSYKNHQLVVVKGGIGKVSSGIIFSTLVNLYPEVELVINIGVSGGVFNKVNIGDIVVANKLFYADVDATADKEYVYGQVPDCPVFFKTKIELINTLKLEKDYYVGSILTGDQFFSDREKINDLINAHFENENILCLDMESTALAQSAWFYGIDYLAIRAISDVIGKEFQFQQYMDNVEKACVNSNLFLIELLKKI